MKSYQTLLAALLGCVGGIVLGYFVAQDSPRLNSGIVPSSAPSAPTPEDSSLSDRALSVASSKGWLKKTTAFFENTPADQQTPGLANIFKEALRTEAPFDQSRLLTLIEMLPKEDFPAALEILRKAKFNYGATAMTGPPLWIAFWRRFGELDPATALAKSREVDDLKYPGKNYLEKHLFSGMARANPVAAAETLLANPDTPNRKNAVEGVMREWAAKDANAAFAWAEKLEPEEQKPAIYAAAWAITTNTDISAGNALLKSLPPGAIQESAIHSLENQARQKPELPVPQLLDLVSTLREIGARDRKFEMTIAARCVENDPYAAANYFSQPLANDAKNDFKEFRSVASSWIQRDAKSAENWAKGKETSPAYPIIAREFLRSATEQNNEAEAQRWQAKLDAIQAANPQAR